MEQKNKTFEDIFSSLTKDEKLYLTQILTKEKLTMKAPISNSDGVLVLAALNNQMSLASKLLLAGANVHAKANINTSLLAYASERGKNNIVSVLIKYGADRFLADGNEKALRCAVAQGRTTTVELLLQHRPYDPIKDEITFIDCAKYNDINYLKSFLSLATHSEKCFITALIGAIQFGSLDTTKLLLSIMKPVSISEAVSGVDLLRCKNEILQLLKRFGVDTSSAFSSNLHRFEVTYHLEDIQEVDAIYALFQLAEKSEIGKQQRLVGLQLSASVSGLYSLLSKDEISDAISDAKRNHKGRIGSLGYFQDIGIIIHQEKKTVIDITAYLENFKLSKDEVIKELDKLKKTSQTIPLKQIYKSNTPLFSASKSIECDKRFKKSDQNGVLWVAESIGYIPDETLKAYGFPETQWKRDKKGLDNIVYIYEEPVHTSSTMSNESEEKSMATFFNSTDSAKKAHILYNEDEIKKQIKVKLSSLFNSKSTLEFGTLSPNWHVLTLPSETSFELIQKFVENLKKVGLKVEIAPSFSIGPISIPTKLEFKNTLADVLKGLNEISITSSLNLDSKDDNFSILEDALQILSKLEQKVFDDYETDIIKANNKGDSFRFTLRQHESKLEKARFEAAFHLLQEIITKSMYQKEGIGNHIGFMNSTFILFSPIQMGNLKNLFINIKEVIKCTLIKTFEDWEIFDLDRKMLTRRFQDEKSKEEVLGNLKIIFDCYKKANKNYYDWHNCIFLDTTHSINMEGSIFKEIKQSFRYESPQEECHVNLELKPESSGFMLSL